MNILAIDPGGTTGLAMRVGDDITTVAIKDPALMYKLVYKWCENEDALVVCEDFRAQKIDHYMLDAIKLVGGIQSICCVTNTKLVMQYNTIRAKWAQQDAHKFLKERGARFVIHEEDALAHLYVYEQRVKDGHA